jgi:succinate-semialdehyde dehydrogenase/glutarate-semialdehyde dehydrogenase
MSTERLRSVDPRTGTLIREWAPHGPDETDQLLDRAAAAARDWATRPVSERSAALLACAALLEERAEVLAQRITHEMGKPLSQAESEVQKCAWVCRHYAEHGPAMLAPERVSAKVPDNRVEYRPLGPVLAIMPWNFPAWQVWRFAAPALMAGNAILVKHAPNTQGCGEDIAQLARDAGLPDGLLTHLRLPVERVEAVIADRRVRAVTLTGSDRAGRAVARAAGAALKKCVLELGGNDPFLILDDADVEEVARQAVKGRLLNAGQVCNSPKRIFVPRALSAAFEAAVLAEVDRQVVGDPTHTATTVGPLARPDIRETVHEQVQQTVAAGARLLRGGRVPEGPGFAYPVTVLADVPAASPAGQDELFGPVLALFVYDDEAAAVAQAADTRFGLCASIWSRDPERARAVGAQLDVGGVFINQVPYSDPRLPFGGVKDSGHGRELGLVGIRELVNVKTVSIG